MPETQALILTKAEHKPPVVSSKLAKELIYVVLAVCLLSLAFL